MDRWWGKIIYIAEERYNNIRQFEMSLHYPKVTMTMR